MENSPNRQSNTRFVPIFDQLKEIKDQSQELVALAKEVVEEIIGPENAASPTSDSIDKVSPDPSVIGIISDDLSLIRTRIERVKQTLYRLTLSAEA